MEDGLTNSSPTTHDALMVAVALLLLAVLNHPAPPMPLTSNEQSPMPVDAEGAAHPTLISLPVGPCVSTARIEQDPVVTRVRPCDKALRDSAHFSST